MALESQHEELLALFQLNEEQQTLLQQSKDNLRQANERATMAEDELVAIRDRLSKLEHALAEREKMEEQIFEKDNEINDLKGKLKVLQSFAVTFNVVIRYIKMPERNYANQR